jgi:hypothetical protein
MHILLVLVSSLEYIYPYLKVVYNEKQLRWMLLVMSMGHRRSRFNFLNFAVVFSSTYFPFPPSTDKILGDAHWTSTSILACLNTNDASYVPCAVSNRAPNKKQNPRKIIRHLKAHRIRYVSPIDTGGIVHVHMSPSSFMYLRLLLSPSLHLSPLHLHLPPNSKRESAPNSSVRIAFWHENRLILCLYLAETEMRGRIDDDLIKR